MVRHADSVLPSVCPMTHLLMQMLRAVNSAKLMRSWSETAVG